MRTVVLAALLIPLVAACSDDGDSTPTCSEAFAEGRADPGEVMFCMDGEKRMLAASAYYDCEDGSTLHWNPWAWWSSVDNVAHAHAAGEDTPPEDMLSECLGWNEAP